MTFERVNAAGGTPRKPSGSFERRSAGGGAGGSDRVVATLAGFGERNRDARAAVVKNRRSGDDDEVGRRNHTNTTRFVHSLVGAMPTLMHAAGGPPEEGQYRDTGHEGAHTGPSGAAQPHGPEHLCEGFERCGHGWAARWLRDTADRAARPPDAKLISMESRSRKSKDKLGICVWTSPINDNIISLLY